MPRQNKKFSAKAGASTNVKNTNEKKRNTIRQKPELAAPAMPSIERDTKIANIRTRLAEMRQYKRILAQDGLEPDSEDKRLESELIVQLLRLEKGLTAKAKPKPPRHKSRSSRHR